MLFRSSSREDIEDNLDVLRQRSRDLYMGVPLATGAIKTMRTNIVGRGLKLKPTIDREVLGIDADAAHALERRIEKEWELWADTPDCDAARIDNFCELQQLAFVSWLVSGDCLALLPVKKRTGQPYDLRVRLIEADRLSSPGGFDTMDDRIIGGVETDSTGEVIAYHFSKHHPLSLASQPMLFICFLEFVCILPDFCVETVKFQRKNFKFHSKNAQKAPPPPRALQ